MNTTIPCNSYLIPTPPSPNFCIQDKISKIFLVETLSQKTKSRKHSVPFRTHMYYFLLYNFQRYDGIKGACDDAYSERYKYGINSYTIKVLYPFKHSKHTKI